MHIDRVIGDVRPQAAAFDLAPEPGRHLIIGITVSRTAAECIERVGRIAREAAALVGQPIELAVEEILVRDGFIGEGYGIPSPEGVETIRLVAQTEGLLLDPTYTGGEPGLFAHPEIAAPSI